MMKLLIRTTPALLRRSKALCLLAEKHIPHFPRTSSPPNKLLFQSSIKCFHSSSVWTSDYTSNKDDSAPIIGKVSQETLTVGTSASLQKVIGSEDIRLFSELTGDWNPIHHRKDNPIVHGALLNGLVSGVIGSKLPGPGTLLLKQTLRFPNPCYVGDTVIVTVEISGVGRIITCNYNITSKKCNNIVLEGEAKLLIKNDFL